MSGHDLPPLEPELDSLFEAERAGPGMPVDARQRVMKRVGVTLGVAMGAMSLGSASAAGLLGNLLGKLLGNGLLIGSGIAIGVAGHAVIASSHAVPIYARLSHDLVVIAPAPQREARATEAAPEAPGASSAPPASPAPATSTAVASRDRDLAAERALLEVARTALSRGQSDSALSALRQHAARFRNGQLADERESLWIQALVLSGSRDEAQQRADGFRRRSPNSMLLPGVDEALKQPSQ